jgi:hypothetical protein
MHPKHDWDLGVWGKARRANDIQIQTFKLVLFELVDRELVERNAEQQLLKRTGFPYLGTYRSGHVIK